MSQLTRHVINLRGPDGNAFALIGYARSAAIELGWTRVQINNMLEEMMSGDYENILMIIEDNFSMFYRLENK